MTRRAGGQNAIHHVDAEAGVLDDFFGRAHTHHVPRFVSGKVFERRFDDLASALSGLADAEPANGVAGEVHFDEAFGGFAALLSIFSATRTDGTLAAASLGIVTTLAAAIGAYFQAGHYEAIALKYRETAEALDRKVVEFRAAPSLQNQQQLVVDAETLMQSENAAWLNEVTAKT